MLEEIFSNLFLLQNCCYAVTAINTSSSQGTVGVMEVIAACGCGSIAFLEMYSSTRVFRYPKDLYFSVGVLNSRI
jgi:hypothetical protein